MAAGGLEVAPVLGLPDREFCVRGSHYVHGLREGDRLNVLLDSADGFHLQHGDGHWAGNSPLRAVDGEVSPRPRAPRQRILMPARTMRPIFRTRGDCR
jgi:hypothetical protein